MNSIVNVPLTAAEVSKLAQDRGCVLKSLPVTDDTDPAGDDVDRALLYWVENPVFISRPYHQLDDLVRFIQILPVFCSEYC